MKRNLGNVIKSKQHTIDWLKQKLDTDVLTASQRAELEHWIRINQLMVDKLMLEANLKNLSS